MLYWKTSLGMVASILLTLKNQICFTFTDHRLDNRLYFLDEIGPKEFMNYYTNQFYGCNTFPLKVPDFFRKKTFTGLWNFITVNKASDGLVTDLCENNQ